MNLDANRTVRDLAIAIPNATRVLEKLGIDYCCGGSKSLKDACMQAQVPVEDVMRALEQADGLGQSSKTNSPDLAGALCGLIDYIVNTHHAYVKQEIPRLHQLLKKVVSVHGKNHPELSKIQQVFDGVSTELASHMMKEERILFPYISALEKAIVNGTPKPRPAFGSVGNPVHMMELEHESAGAALKEISTLSSSYTAPEDGCFSYRTLYTALKEFEADLHQHVHLENNSLFPRAIELESGV
jgi:regulator of cell morphogenesis and NO signaling